MRKYRYLATLISLSIASCGPLPATLASAPAGPPAGEFRTHATEAAQYVGFPAISGEPVAFRDARAEMASPPTWLQTGDWSMQPTASGFTGGVLHQEATKSGTAPWVSMRRYAGDTFGPDGQLPSRYRLSIAVQPSAMPGAPTSVGENAVLVYYKDPTHFVEVVVGNSNVAVWSADGATPLSNAGWKGHYWFGQQTRPGDVRRVSCEIDTATRLLTYWVEGRKAGTVTIPMMTHDGYHGFALRSIGNKQNWGDVTVADLSGGTVTPTPTPTPTPSPTPTPTPGSGYTYVTPIASTVEGSELPDWADVTGPTWLNHAAWTISGGLWRLPSYTGTQYAFRRYAGTTFGADGRMPDLYQVTYRIKPAGPTGQISVIPYYLDATHYEMIRLNLTDKNVSIIEYIGGTPTSGSGGTYDLSQNHRGWQPLPAPDADGAYTIRVKVNAQWHSMSVYVSGRWIDTPYVPAVNQQPHWAAVRTNGTAQSVVSVEVLKYDSPSQAQ